ncbi:MAG TPA: alpha/beta fold hydrolase [Candidatus Angelobacter sp.]|nr:alpha/beta fold hydrolase [Candidatus Angelobacter sp.]
MNFHFSIDQSNPLVPLHAPHSIECPVFCIPGAGASVTSFVEFVNALDEKLPIYGLQPRGIDIAEQPHESVEDAALYNLRALARFNLTRPIHLLGHSHGGLVAFEMALRLHEQGRSVASLTLIDTEPPDSIGEAPRQISTAEILREFTEAFEDTFDKSLGIDPAVIASGQAEVFVNELNAALIKARVLPLRNNIAMLRGSLATFTAACNCKYIPGRCYANTLHLVLVGPRPRSNRSISMEDVREKWRIHAAKWRRHAAAVDIWYGPGHHFSILQSPQVYLLAKWWQQATALSLSNSEPPD